MPAIGIDVVGTKCLGIVLDGDRVVAETKRPTPHTPQGIIDTLVAVVEEHGLTGGLGGAIAEWRAAQDGQRKRKGIRNADHHDPTSPLYAGSTPSERNPRDSMRAVSVNEA